MGSYEVRIHYAANNMVSEDARWMKVARGIASFKPIRKVRLLDSIVDASELSAASSASQPQPHRTTQPIEISSGPEPISRSQSPPITVRDIVNEYPIPGQRKRKPSTSFEKRSSERNKRTRGTSYARTKKGLNPTFKSPIIGYLKSGKASWPSINTPRRELGPETTILVPVTKSPRPSAETPGTTGKEICGIQTDRQNQLTPGLIDETSFTDHSMSLTDTPNARLDAEVQIREGACSSANQSYPCNQEQLLSGMHHMQRRTTQELDTSSYPCPTGFTESNIGIGTSVAPSTNEHSNSTPVATTATPSDHGHYTSVSSPLASKGNKCSSAVIDLTASPDQHALHMARRAALGPVSSPILEQQRTYGSKNAAVIARNREILSLPRKAMCQATCTVRSRSFESFVPRYLRDLAGRFELQNQFRPVLAPDQIQNSQRGYWSLRIKVADVAAVALARRAPLTSSQWSDRRFMMRQEGLISASVSSEAGNNALGESIYPDKDPGTYMPWTMCELKTFWAYLRKVVERGQAGYDVHATLKHTEPTSEGLEVDVKLYGYAESLSHLWLLLYGVSATLTASMPLQWHVPGAGPLITMSGQLKRGGTLGRWVPRGMGVNGSWGLEDTWDGLSSVVKAIGKDKS